MGDVASEHTREDAVAFLRGVERAAAAMGEGDNAVDVLEAVQTALMVEMIGHRATHGG